MAGNASSPHESRRPPRTAPLRAPAALLRRVRRRLGRSRPHRHDPELSLHPRPHPYARAAGLVAVTVLGAWLGLLAVGSVRTPVGPMDTHMTLRPSFSGGTKINVPPLGALTLDSHHGPLRLDVDVDKLDPVRSRALVDRPERLGALESTISEDVGQGTLDLAVRSCVAVVCGATALGLAVYRRPRRALLSGGLALTLLLASSATAYATWNPRSVLEPRFSGLLSGAPSVVGDARSIVTDFNIYQQELARLVTNMTKLYDATTTLPTYQPDPTTLRLLHVSDIHLNPAAWSIIRSLVKQYDIDLIVDSGDTMDHGTTAENGFLTPVADLGAPYVWVRGNHDSEDTQKAMESKKNVTVLDDGTPHTVAGVRLAGIGDPQFTPDRSVDSGGDPQERREGRALARSLREARAEGDPVDIAVTHNPVAAEQVAGTVPLVLAGHTHNRSQRALPDGTRMMIEGTTGGGGLRAVEDETPQKVQASVLYLDRESKQLQAWDEITLGGLGLTTAEVSRRLPGEARPGSSPSPTVPSTPAPSTEGSPSD
ncbi:metallophosphoesterase [Streptomyces sp. NPDC005438]|uniref:metallophosphoesterase family protein n=1 Tax=Streptomyces sp. NPDC005438 TaxID=3156880 RepID=UPI0033A9503B